MILLLVQPATTLGWHRKSTRVGVGTETRFIGDLAADSLMPEQVVASD